MGTLHQQFIAANSGGIELGVYQHGSRTKLVASFTGDISGSSPTCTVTVGGRSCSFALSIPPGGPYDFLFGTFDEAPVKGVIPNGAKQLGAAITSAKIVAGKANELKITVGGIVARTFVYAPQPTLFHTIASNAETLVAGAMDPDGNIIASDSYVNGNGSRVTIAVGADATAGGTIAITPAQFASPPLNDVTLTYSSLKATAAQLQNGFTTVVKASAPGVPSASFALSVYKPAFPLDYTTTDDPQQVAVLGNTIFVAGFSSNTLNIIANGIRVDAPASEPFGMTVTSDGNLWFTEYYNASLSVAYPQAGFFAWDSQVYTFPPGTVIHGITHGPDGALWLTQAESNGAIFRVAINGRSVAAVTRYPLPTNSVSALGITVGADGALWFVESGGKVGRIPVTATPNSSAQIKEYAIPDYLGTGSDPYTIATAKDGTMWFTDGNQPVIHRITTTGVMTAYPLPHSHTASFIAAAPDGAIWFSELNGYIGRILPTATPANPNVMEFTPADGTSSLPEGITVGPDGSIYYAENNTKAVIQMQ